MEKFATNLLVKRLPGQIVSGISSVSNSLDPNSFGPNCLQMLSIEKTLARVKRSCQKFLGYLKKKSAHMILSAPLP